MKWFLRQVKMKFLSFSDLRLGKGSMFSSRTLKRISSKRTISSCYNIYSIMWIIITIIISITYHHIKISSTIICNNTLQSNIIRNIYLIHVPPHSYHIDGSHEKYRLPKSNLDRDAILTSYSTYDARKVSTFPQFDPREGNKQGHWSTLMTMYYFN
jgi:hypothetical protein